MLVNWITNNEYHDEVLVGLIRRKEINKTNDEPKLDMNQMTNREVIVTYCEQEYSDDKYHKYCEQESKPSTREEWIDDQNMHLYLYLYVEYNIRTPFVFNAFYTRFITQSLPEGTLSGSNAMMYRLMMIPVVTAFLAVALVNDFFITISTKGLYLMLLLEGLALLMTKLLIMVTLNIPLYMAEGVSGLFNQKETRLVPEPENSKPASKALNQEQDEFPGSPETHLTI